MFLNIHENRLVLQLKCPFDKNRTRKTHLFGRAFVSCGNDLQRLTRRDDDGVDDWGRRNDGNN